MSRWLSSGLRRVANLFEPQFGLLKMTPFFWHQKMRLHAVDLEDQKVRLRAVWMGRNLGVKLGLFLGSKIRVEKEAIFETDFCPQKTP